MFLFCSYPIIGMEKSQLGAFVLVRACSCEVKTACHAFKADTGVCIARSNGDRERSKGLCCPNGGGWF